MLFNIRLPRPVEAVSAAPGPAEAAVSAAAVDLLCFLQKNSHVIRFGFN